MVVIMAKVLTGKISHPGVAEGEVLLLTEPVSFWGGVSAACVFTVMAAPDEETRAPHYLVRYAST